MSCQYKNNIRWRYGAVQHVGLIRSQIRTSRYFPTFTNPLLFRPHGRLVWCRRLLNMTVVVLVTNCWFRRLIWFYGDGLCSSDRTDSRSIPLLKPCPHQQHVEATCRTLLRHVECCRSTCCRFWQHVERFFHPFDMSKEIKHVQFLSTCRTNEQQVAVEEAGVDGFVDMSNVHQIHGRTQHDRTCRRFLRFFAIVAMTTAGKLSLSSSSAFMFWLTSLRASSRRMTCMMYML